MSEIIQNELIGLTIAKRQNEITNKKKPKTTPFISMINVKEPIGYTLPKVVIDCHKSKVLNETERKNRLFVHMTESRYKQKEKERLKELSYINKRYFSNCKNFNFNNIESRASKSQNKKLTDMIYFDKLNDKCGIQKFFKTNINNFNMLKNIKPIKENLLQKNNISKPLATNYYTSNDENLALSMEKEVENTQNIVNKEISYNNQVHDDEAKELIEFAKNLNFDKYLKDSSVREALNLIKLKKTIIDEENKEKELNEHLTQEDNERLVKLINDYFNINDVKENQTLMSNTIDITPKIENKNDLSIKEPEEQYKIVLNELHKNNKLKPIHSALSIMKILQRDGIILKDQNQTLTQDKLFNANKSKASYMYSSLINNSLPEQL